MRVVSVAAGEAVCVDEAARIVRVWRLTWWSRLPRATACWSMLGWRSREVCGGVPGRAAEAGAGWEILSAPEPTRHHKVLGDVQPSRPTVVRTQTSSGGTRVLDQLIGDPLRGIR